MGLPVWMIGFLVLVIVVLLAIAVARMGTRINFGFFAQVAAAFALVGIAWLFLDRLGAQDRVEYRRSIEARMSALTAQSLLPNSNLACLDSRRRRPGGGGMREGAVFEPRTGIGCAHLCRRTARRSDETSQLCPSVDRRLMTDCATPYPYPQADRYSPVAGVPQGRDQCAPDKCYAFEFLTEPYLIVVNMKERPMRRG